MVNTIATLPTEHGKDSYPILEIELTPLPSSSAHSHVSGVRAVQRTPNPETLTPSNASLLETPSRKTPEQSRAGRLHLATLFWTIFLNGWDDGSIGPLLPAMQRNYRVGFAVVSLIFVVTFVGFLLGALLNVWLTDRLGFGKVMMLGATSLCITYVIQCPAPPFPVFIISYLFSGFGLSLQNAGANTYVVGLSGHPETKLGLLHACFGLGAFASPLAATYFSNTNHWSFHFIISGGMALCNVIFLGLVFRLKRIEELYAASGDQGSPAEAVDESSKYGQILKLKAVHILAAFSFLYVGTEVTLGGWIVTFIIQEREGGEGSGYISSGFFGGLALGRVALLWLTQKVGARRVIYVYSAVLIALEITIWLVPSLIENAIAISFIGVLLGPMFPIIVNEAKGLLPSWLLAGSIGWISAIGMAGSAALPFLTGLLASKFGIKSLQPLIVSIMSAMVGIWALVPKPRRVE